MANSSWTANHIKSLWQLEIEEDAGKEEEVEVDVKKIQIVHPPCDILPLLQFPTNHHQQDNKTKENEEGGRTPLKFISIGQFRPEKDQLLQVEAFSLFLRLAKNKGGLAHNLERTPPILHIIGSVRNEGDEEILNQVKDLAQKLEIEVLII